MPRHLTAALAWCSLCRMGIHVSRSNRGTAVSRTSAYPSKNRPQTRRPGKGAGGSGAKGGPKTGGSAGTRGDFGAYFE
jgi:hypothetical protein